MQIQFNATAGVQGTESMADWATKEVSQRLARFRHSITRVEVHMRDEKAGRHGEADKRCVLEVRLAGHQPQSVTHTADKVVDALNGACAKAEHALDHLLGKERDAHRRDSIRGSEHNTED